MDSGERLTRTSNWACQTRSVVLVHAIVLVLTKVFRKCDLVSCPTRLALVLSGLLLVAILEVLDSCSVEFKSCILVVVYVVHNAPLIIQY